VSASSPPPLPVHTQDVVPIRSGLIGLGMIGAVHARGVRAAGGKVVAVVGSGRTSVLQAAYELGAEPHQTADALIESPDVDVVHICTPNHLHAELAERALSAGKHVICEKPLSTDVASSRRLADLAGRVGKVAAVPFVYRFYPTVRDARQRTLSGETGVIRLLHGSYLQDWLVRPDARTWRLDPKLGGQSRAFGDIGIHWCDLIEFVTGHRITRLTARLLAVGRAADDGSLHIPGTEDAASIVFETDRGALGSLMVSQITPGRKNRLWFSIDGSKSSLSFDQELPDTLWVGDLKAAHTVSRATDTGNPAIDRYNILPPGHPQGYQDSFTGFIADVYASIAGAQVDGLPTFEDGLRSALLAEAVLESAASSEWVELVQ
jgi:predicted dehydrogenase